MSLQVSNNTSSSSRTSLSSSSFFSGLVIFKILCFANCPLIRVKTKVPVKESDDSNNNENHQGDYSYSHEPPPPWQRVLGSSSSQCDINSLVLMQLVRFVKLANSITPKWRDAIFQHIASMSLSSSSSSSDGSCRFFFFLSSSSHSSTASSIYDSSSLVLLLCQSVSSALRRLFETIAMSPSSFTRTRGLFREVMFKILTEASKTLVSSSKMNGGTSVDAQSDLAVLDQLKLPLQHRVLSPDKKYLAVAIGKDITLYPIIPTTTNKKTRKGIMNFDFKELGSVKPKMKSSYGFLEDSTSNVTGIDENNYSDQTDSAIEQRIQPLMTTTTTRMSLSKSSTSSSSNSLAELDTLQRNKFCAYRSVFSNDSRILAVSCLDGTIRFGDARNGQLKATLHHHHDDNDLLKRNDNTNTNKKSTNDNTLFIESLCFSHDDRTLFFCAGTRIFVARVFDDEGYLEPRIISVWREEEEEDEKYSSSCPQRRNEGCFNYINNLIMLIPQYNILASCNGDDESFSLLELHGDDNIDRNSYQYHQKNDTTTTTLKLLTKVKLRSVTDDDDDGEESNINKKKKALKERIWVRDLCCCRRYQNNEDDNTTTSSEDEQHYWIFAVSSDRTLRCFELTLRHSKNNNNVTVCDCAVKLQESRVKPPMITEHNKSSKLFGVSLATFSSSSSDRLLAVGSTDGDIRIYDVHTWKERKNMILTGDGFGLLTCFSFPPTFNSSSSSASSSTFLITGSHLNTAKIWRIDPSKDESQCIKVISFASSVLSIAFAPNCEKLVLTDFYGNRRFFGIFCYPAETNMPKKMIEKCIGNNDNVITKTRDETRSEFPIISLQFVPPNEKNDTSCEEEDEDEDEPYLVCAEDLLGNVKIFGC